ncbi:Zn-ribbon domain-containing OB-fold protein [Halomarina halobia]|uniref:Zn-ribbon domain-containing OB-fold protein n=1 Tax=Halomarina halobia TaxID=3033386 RepID=A0ABD6A4U9_9EURY|nr:Zn-ribbon domain-containing OB-fold protein [Halomarina sp. PSR21]
MTGPLAPDDLDADSPFTLPGFFAALADGRLLGATCEDCGTALVPPRPACYACGGRAVAVEEQPRSGTVVSHTEVRTPPPAFADLAPYTVAVVELDSGARLTGRVDAPYDAVGIGSRVELAVREPTDAERAAALSYEDGWPIHVFEPA